MKFTGLSLPLDSQVIVAGPLLVWRVWMPKVVNDGPEIFSWVHRKAAEQGRLYLRGQLN